MNIFSSKDNPISPADRKLAGLPPEKETKQSGAVPIRIIYVKAEISPSRNFRTTKKGKKVLTGDPSFTARIEMTFSSKYIIPVRSAISVNGATYLIVESNPLFSKAVNVNTSIFQGIVVQSDTEVDACIVGNYYAEESTPRPKFIPTT